MYPTIQICFSLSGENIPFSDITSQIGLEPTCCRRKDEWPKPSVLAGVATDIWELKLPRVHSRSLDQAVGLLTNILRGKEETLLRLCKIYSLKVTINIPIHWIICAHPELTLSNDNLSFLSKINASVGIDPYVYED